MSNANREKDSFHDTNGYNKGFCWGLTLTTTLGMMLAGYGGGVLNTIQGYISNQVFGWSKEDAVVYGGLMNSMLCGGGAAGTLLGGILAKTFGRKNTMIFADVIGVIGAICTTVANLPLFLLGRTLIGFAGGVNCTVVPLYISEVAPLPMKGPTGAAIQAACSFGTVVSLLLGYGMPREETVETSWWRFMVGLPVLICGLRAILLLTIYNLEPPKYLITKGRDEEAKRILARIYHERHIMDQVTAIKTEIAQTSSSAKEMAVTDLFTPRWRKRFLVGIFIAASPQLTFVTGISFYSTNMFKDITGDQFKAQTLTCIMMTMTLLANFGAGPLIAKVGRKHLFLGGALFMALVWGGETIFIAQSFTTAAEISFFVFFIIFGLTYGPVPWVFVAEVLPDIAIGIGLFLNYMGQVIVAQIFPLLITSMPVYGFLIPGAITLGLFLAVLAFVPETKDKTPQEITALFYNNESVEELGKSLVASEEKTSIRQSDSSNIWV